MLQLGSIFKSCSQRASNLSPQLLAYLDVLVQHSQWPKDTSVSGNTAAIVNDYETVLKEHSLPANVKELKE
eukprot:2586289-Rhodomonas_salina.1